MLGMVHGKISKLLANPGDFWGGLSATLVAVPAGVAFGAAIFSAIDPSHAAEGAIYGAVGVGVISLVAAAIGGTDKLVSAPCAPAAAVMSSFAGVMSAGGASPSATVTLMVVMAFLAGIFQIILGFAGIGRLIKFIPYPVVSGYMAAVGISIIADQLPNFFGVHKTGLFHIVTNSALWDIRSVFIGVSAISGYLWGNLIIKSIPGPLWGVLAGFVSYWTSSLFDPSLFSMADNRLVLGRVATSISGYAGGLGEKWREIGDIRLFEVAGLLGGSATLAVLLSVDTLKTCVVLDRQSDSYSPHEPNRELFAQGIANCASAMMGGMPGAGTMGATLTNIAGGGSTRMSGIFVGIMSLSSIIAFSSVISWIPHAALAGGLIVIGFRMIDFSMFEYLESKTTAFEFLVASSVVVTAMWAGLIAASLAGVGLAMVLFVREQIGNDIVRRKGFVGQRFSTWHRPESHVKTIQTQGERSVIFEMQGSLFFGTSNRMIQEILPETERRDFIIIDLARVQSLDITATAALAQIVDRASKRGAKVVFSGINDSLTNGAPVSDLFKRAGISFGEEAPNAKSVANLDGAIEWVEDRILRSADLADSTSLKNEEAPIDLAQMELFAGRKDETLEALSSRLVERNFEPGAPIYSAGEQGSAIFLIRSGEVRIFSSVGGSRSSRHVASFGRGDFFGGLAFLDGMPRGNSAVARGRVCLYELSSEQFDKLAEEHKKLAFDLMRAIAKTLAIRLRHADTETEILRD